MPTFAFVPAFVPAYRRLAAGSSLVFWSLLLLSVASDIAADSAGGVVIEVAALTGQEAPGSPAGVTFADFGSVIADLPSIDEPGRHAFHGFLEGPGIGPGNDVGIWLESFGVLSPVALAGSPAPGAGPGAVFLNFQLVEVSLAPGIAAGQTVFFATLTGGDIGPDNDFGVWRDEGDQLALVVREGDPAPGRPSAQVIDIFPSSIGDDGALVLFARRSGAGISALEDEGLLGDGGGSLEWLLLEGDPVPGAGAGVVFRRDAQGSASAFLFAAWNEARGLIALARIFGPGVDGGNDEILVADNGGVLEIVAREGDAVPGVPGHQFGGPGQSAGFSAPVVNGDGHLAFGVSVSGSSTGSALFSDRSGSLELEVMTGDPAPGTALTFATFGAPALDDHGRLAFRASLQDGGTGIWWDPAGELERLVGPGAPISPTGGIVVNIGQLFGLADNGAVAFQGIVELPGVVFASALMLGDPTGAVHTLAIQGQPFDIPGADTRVVSTIGAVSLGEQGLGFQLDFTDSSSGRFTARLPSAGFIFADGFESGDLSAWSP